jgi:hypothetical protein
MNRHYWHSSIVVPIFSWSSHGFFAIVSMWTYRCKQLLAVRNCSYMFSDALDGTLTISSVFKPWFTAPDQWGGRYRWRITTSWYARNMYWCTHLVCSIFYAQISDIAMQFRPNVLQGQKANSYFSSTSLMPIDFRTKFKVDTYQFGHVNFWIYVLIRSFKSGYYLCLFTVAHLVLHHTYLLTLTKWDCHFAPSPHYPKT